MNNQFKFLILSLGAWVPRLATFIHLNPNSRHAMNARTSSITDIPHYVGGTRFAGTSSRSQGVTNPASGAVTGQVALANAADVNAAVAAAQAAFPA